MDLPEIFPSQVIKLHAVLIYWIGPLRVMDVKQVPGDWPVTLYTWWHFHLYCYYSVITITVSHLPVLGL